MGLSSLPSVLKSRGVAGTAKYLFRAGRFLSSRLVPGKKFAEYQIWDGEYKMLLNVHDNGISRALALNGKREMQLRAILEEVVKPGMCVFDLGANIGYYAIWEALRVGPEGRVYCIEPSPANFALLQMNVDLNGMRDRMEMYNVGAADRLGEADFHLAEYSNLHTFMAEQYKFGDKSKRLLSGQTIKVPLTTVSEFAKGKRKIDLIRMDVEGFEVEVIDGMEEAFKNDPGFGPAICFETHFPKYDDTHHSMRKRLCSLFDKGYRVTRISSNSEKKNQHILEMGYKPYKTLMTSDTHMQGLYKDIKNEDAEKLICDLGGVRDVLLYKF
ncbi:MAG: FkbM family methyltransferase [Victivallales bacterium]